jgi:tetratricopeptide (TPR) repeat protein
LNIEQLYEQGDYEAIIDSLEGSPNEDYLSILAFSYQKTKRWENAMECWNHLIIKDPTNAEYFNERGVCKFNLRFKHAIQDFDQAVKLDPENAYFYSCRAYIKDKTGDTEGSVEDYTKSLSLDPTDAIIMNNLGLAEQKLGHTAKARAQFKSSDELLGIETIDSRDDEANSTASPSLASNNQSPTLWDEFKKMISSKAGFKQFWAELRGK